MMSTTTIVLRRSNRSAKAPASGPSTIAGSRRKSSTPPRAKLAAANPLHQGCRGRGDRQQAEPVAEARQRHRHPQPAEVADPQDRPQLGHQPDRTPARLVGRAVTPGLVMRRLAGGTGAAGTAVRRPVVTIRRPAARPPRRRAAAPAASGRGMGLPGVGGWGAPLGGLTYRSIRRLRALFPLETGSAGRVRASLTRSHAAGDRLGPRHLPPLRRGTGPPFSTCSPGSSRAPPRCSTWVRRGYPDRLAGRALAGGRVTGSTPPPRCCRGRGVRCSGPRRVHPGRRPRLRARRPGRRAGQQRRPALGAGARPADRALGGLAAARRLAGRAGTRQLPRADARAAGRPVHSPRWAARRARSHRARTPSWSPRATTTSSWPPACPDVWETTYLHVLTGPDPVLGWGPEHGAAAGARPCSTTRRPPSSRPSTRRRCGRPTPRAASPRRPPPFRRVFAVATRPV